MIDAYNVIIKADSEGNASRRARRKEDTERKTRRGRHGEEDTEKKR